MAIECISFVWCETLAWAIESNQLLSRSCSALLRKAEALSGGL